MTTALLCLLLVAAIWLTGIAVILFFAGSYLFYNKGRDAWLLILGWPVIAAALVVELIFDRI